MSEDKTKENLTDEELKSATGGGIELDRRVIYYATCMDCGNVWRLTMGPKSCPQCGSENYSPGRDSKGKAVRPNHGKGSGIT